MPFKSPKQERLMQGVAHSASFAKKMGIPQSVGKKFVKHASEGGEMKESKSMIGKELAFMKKKGAPKSMIKHEKAEMGSMKKPPMKKMASGGLSAGHKQADGVAHKGKTKGAQVKMRKGGYC